MLYFSNLSTMFLEVSFDQRSRNTSLLYINIKSIQINGDRDVRSKERAVFSRKYVMEIIFEGNSLVHHILLVIMQSFDPLSIVCSLK